MSRPAAELDHLTEQPGPRTHGHGARQLRRARRMGACETTPPHHTPGTLTGPSQPQRERTLLASHDRPPFVGVQLVRPRRCAAAGAPAGPLPHDDATPAAARKIQKNSQPGCNRGHRARPSHPLDTNGPHGCRQVSFEPKCSWRKTPEPTTRRARTSSRSSVESNGAGKCTAFPDHFHLAARQGAWRGMRVRARQSCTGRIAIEPSPTARATRLMEPRPTSPTAKCAGGGRIRAGRELAASGRCLGR